MMQPPGAPKKNNTMMIAIIIAVVAIVVIAVVALVVLNGGSSAANLHVLTIDKSKVTLFDWGLNGGHVTVDVTVQNTGLSAASGTLKVEIQIGSYKYSGTSSIPTTQSGDERTISVDVTIPALQAGMMGTFYEPIVTATVQ